MGWSTRNRVRLEVHSNEFRLQRQSCESFALDTCAPDTKVLWETTCKKTSSRNNFTSNIPNAAAFEIGGFSRPLYARVGVGRVFQIQHITTAVLVWLYSRHDMNKSLLPVVMSLLALSCYRPLIVEYVPLVTADWAAFDMTHRRSASRPLV